MQGERLGWRLARGADADVNGRRLKEGTRWQRQHLKV